MLSFRFLKSLSQALDSYLAKMSGFELLKAVYHLCILGHFPPVPLQQLLHSSTLEHFKTTGLIYILLLLLLLRLCYFGCGSWKKCLTSWQTKTTTLRPQKHIVYLDSSFSSSSLFFFSSFFPPPPTAPSPPSFPPLPPFPATSCPLPFSFPPCPSSPPSSSSSSSLYLILPPQLPGSSPTRSGCSRR